MGNRSTWAGRLVLCFALGSAMVWAQTQGQITGVVTDQSGAVVDGARVTVTNPQTGFTRQVLTNSAGNYVFPTLLPGLYNLKAEKTGFAIEERKGIELQVNQVARVDFPLRIGGVAEQVQEPALMLARSEPE